MENSVRYADIADKLKGSSLAQFTSMLWALALARYADKDLLNQVSPKLGTDKKLAFFTDQGYITSYSGEYYTIAPKGLKLLEEQGKNISFIKTDFTGSYSSHQQKLSAVTITEYRTNPALFSVIYPTFKKNNASWLIPDACFVYRKDGMAKIVFVEVEIDKNDWLNYLHEKKHKYDEQGQNEQMYSVWWKHWSKKLNMEYCKQEEFCFSILCFADFKENWDGWKFRENR